MSLPHKQWKPNRTDPPRAGYHAGQVTGRPPTKAHGAADGHTIAFSAFTLHAPVPNSLGAAHQSRDELSAAMMLHALGRGGRPTFCRSTGLWRSNNYE